ncbi:MAG: transposase [Microcystis aeruginosa G11-06]|nr:transposase [Microcystis aeruginosa G11-06]NCS48893.1 transposase [Microcystis aeruginosa BK11-02]
MKVVAFCDLESQTEFRLATDFSLEEEGAVSNEEVAEIYIERWQIELLWKFLKMHLKLDNPRVRASQTLLTIEQFFDPFAVWAFQVI